MAGMNTTKRFLALTLASLLYAAPVFCAPVGNIGDPIVWGEGLVFNDWDSSLFLAVGWDRQRNTLPNQQRMPMWDDPRTPQDEVRHYEQIRGSDNELTCSTFTLGAAINHSWALYLLYGLCDSKINLAFADKTVEWGFIVENTFKSDGDPFYGIGLSAIMHEGVLWGRPWQVGLDIKYRRFDFEVDNLAESGTFYAATLDEVQMALVVSADTGRLHPYAGVRISSTTGKEHYINQTVSAPFYDAGFIDYEDDITWSKNLGYVVGATFAIRDAIAINLELRVGDEEALGCSASIRF